VLTDRDVNEAVFAAPGLHLQKGQQRSYLFFDGIQTNKLIKIGLNFSQRSGWTHALGCTSSAATLGEEFLCVASSEFACFKQTFADVIGSGDYPKLLGCESGQLPLRSSGLTNRTFGQQNVHMRTWASEEAFDDFIAAEGIVEPGDEMAPRYRKEVFRFMEMHANSELFGGLCEQYWVSRAPGLHRKLAFLAKTQDEIGHAHLLYMVAADLGVKTRQQMLDDLFAGRSKFHNVFHYKTHTWADQIVVAFLVDAAALTTQQAVLKNCSYGPYRRVLRRIVSEEGFHMRHGEEMLLTLADGTDIQRHMFQAALDRWWEPVMHFFGPPTKDGDLLIRWRVKSETNEALRDKYIQKFVPMLHSYGFTIPDPALHQNADDRWVIGDIDWTALSSTQSNSGEDSRQRIARSRAAWEDTEWVRRALDHSSQAQAHAQVA
jgi:ring-1,2-phenylacetyl-CoA epoxidase subunit PaaA